MTEEELKQLHGIINEIWQLLKKFGPTVSLEDEYWSELLDTDIAICEKWGRHPLGDQLILTCVDYLEARAKGDGQVEIFKNKSRRSHVRHEQA